MVLQSQGCHSNGITDLSIDLANNAIVTCGSDGDVRHFAKPDDADFESHNIANECLSVAAKDNSVYVATDEEIVILSFPSWDREGIVSRCTAPTYDLQLNKTGSHLLSSTGEFNVRYINIETKDYISFEGHEAPIIYTGLNDSEELMASVSCDSTLRIWNTFSRSCVKLFTDILPAANSIPASKVLCQFCWANKGRILCVPRSQIVEIYDPRTWRCASHKLQMPPTSSVLWNAVTATDCGTYACTGGSLGSLCVWDLRNCGTPLNSQRNSACSPIYRALFCSDNSTVVFTDFAGNYGYISDATVKDESQNIQTTPVAEVAEDKEKDHIDESSAQDLLDNVSDDDEKTSRKNDPEVNPLDGLFEDEDPADDEGDDAESITRMKKRIAPHLFEDDEESRSVAGSDAVDNIRPSNAVEENSPTKVEIRTVYRGPEPTPLQEAFQPASTPVHLPTRFMVWNRVGMVRQYQTDEENTIDVEFLDASTHHSLTFGNSAGYTMADLSADALILASPGDEDKPSSLMCNYFRSWDESKEWAIDMPENETIETIGLGNGWLAAATSCRFLRLFSLGGIQRDLFCLPGQVVTVAAQESRVCVVYHMGTGISGDQCLGYMLIEVSPRSARLISQAILPLSVKSILTWLGFSLEHSLVAVDSSGFVRLYQHHTSSWVQIADTKAQTKGKSDNFWIVGVYETQLQIRCILCKGSTYPSVLPRPVLTVLKVQLPLCDPSAEKSTLEENILRSQSLYGSLDPVSDAEAAAIIQNQKQQNLMKLFALSCKSGKEYRAFETGAMFDTAHALELAIRYAMRSRHLTLAKKLGELLETFQEDEPATETVNHEVQSHSVNSEKDFRDDLNASVNQVETEWNVNRGHSPQKRSKTSRHQSEEQSAEADSNDTSVDVNGSVDAREPLARVTNVIQSSSPKPRRKRNPFKTQSSPDRTNQGARGSDVFDGLVKSPQKVQPAPVVTARSPVRRRTSSVQKRKNQNRPDIIMVNDGAAVQTKLSGLLQKRARASSPPIERENSESESLPSYNEWAAANETRIQEENPHLPSDEIQLLTIKKYKTFVQVRKQATSGTNSNSALKLSKFAFKT